MSSNFYRDVVSELKAAGFEKCRANGHDTWKKKQIDPITGATSERGVSFSRTINNPIMRRHILRSAGINQSIREQSAVHDRALSRANLRGRAKLFAIEP